SRAITSAVAGAITIASAFAAIATCISPEYDASHMSVATAFPQIPDNVTGPTNFVADAVITGKTVAPAFTQSRAISTLLYGAMLPVTASATMRPSKGLPMRFAAF